MSPHSSQIPDSDPFQTESSPLLVTNQPSPTTADHVILDVADLSDHSEDSRNPPWWTVLFLPGRIAVGALSYFAGASLSRRVGFHGGAAIVGGCLSVVLGQAVVSTALRRSRSLRQAQEVVLESVGDAKQMAWLDAIQAVGKIVGTFSDGLRGPGGAKHLFLDTTLVRMLHESLYNDELRAVKRRPSSPTDALILGRYYLDYALSTYGFLLLKLMGVMDPSYNAFVEGTRGVDVARYMLRLDKEHIIVSVLDGEGIKVPRHFVAIDKEMKSIVVAIRGTNSISDIITDLLCDNAPFAGGYAHGGMKEAAEALYTAILPTLKKLLTQYPIYSIVLTGHSLGAGVAILLTKVLLMNGFTDVKCYAIAPCPVFGPMHSVDSDWSDALECFVHADDLVSKLCLASARDIAMELERIDFLNLPASRKKEMIRSHNMTELGRMLRREQRTSRDPRKKQVGQLYIPSHSGVHWLVPEKVVEGEKTTRDLTSIVEIDHEHVGTAYVPVGAYCSYVVRPRLFERLLITQGCINAHFPSSYTGAFASLDLPPPKRRLPTPSNPTFRQLWYASELG